MSIYKDTLKEKVLKHLKNSLLGPGNEPTNNPFQEVIHEAPLRRYYTGVLFPYNHGNRTITLKSESPNDDLDHAGGVPNGAEGSGSDDDTPTAALSTSAFYPDSAGLTFCVPADTTYITVTCGGGLYRKAETEDRTLPLDQISTNDFNEIFADGGAGHSEFEGRIKLNETHVYIEPKFGEVLGNEFQERHPLYKKISKFEKEIGDRFDAFKWLYALLGTAFKRDQLDFRDQVSLNIAEQELQVLSRSIDGKEDVINIVLYAKVWEHRNKRYVRLQLLNKTKAIRDKGESSHDLNIRCLFQSYIEATLPNGAPFLPYQEPRVGNIHNEEAKEIAFVYRDQKSYAVGHNTSVSWDEKDGTCNLVRTEWMPDTWSPTVSTEPTEENSSEATKVLNLRSLLPEAHGGLPWPEMKRGLETFVSNYEHWIAEQEQTAVDPSDEGTKNKIVARQKAIRDRIKLGIHVLDKDTNALPCFRLANLAMHIQMVLGRDKRFGGTLKSLADVPEDSSTWSTLDSFLNSEVKTAYRPFQLAFFLLAIPGIVQENREEERNLVDLIWFPTGGGKTEAYLALTAFTICLRRIRVPEAQHGGTTVLMRYTLRLLAAQQFERASRLICALDFLRTQKIGETLGSLPITIGLYVGGTTTPNNLESAQKVINDICSKNEKQKLSANKFQIERCPWCGTGLIETTPNATQIGFEVRTGVLPGKRKEAPIGLEIFCLQPSCHFYRESVYGHDGHSLPVLVVDEDIYQRPPTLLFGTVDKFAQLAWHEDAGKLFGKQNGNNPPELIIQDELHLLSGPLGSIVGLFELVIEQLCRNKAGLGPKIIASTATTRNTSAQIKALYGDKKSVSVFPAPGLNYTDSYFAKQLPSDQSKRCYLGFMPTGKTGLEAQLQLFAHLFVARIRIWDAENRSHLQSGDTLQSWSLTNAFWTLLSYYNSLKDLGISHSKISYELSKRIPEIQKQHFPNRATEAFYFNTNGIQDGDTITELTSRVPSHEIKSNLSAIEKKFDSNTFMVDGKGKHILKNVVVDLVMATSMVSVGVDVSRLNLMVMNGMPRTVAEYIQASSRVARNTEGLVVLTVSPSRARERSHFEHFIEFHQGFYKFVEPLSATPCTEVTIERMLPTLLTAYVRTCEDGMFDNDQATNVKPEFASNLQDLIKNHWVLSDEMQEFLKAHLDSLMHIWASKAANSGDEPLVFWYPSKTKTSLLLSTDQTNGQSMTGGQPTWMGFNAMREIGAQTWIKLTNPNQA